MKQFLFFQEKMNVTPDIWEDFLTILKEETGSNVVETWFKAVSLRNWDASNNTVYLEAPNPFVCDWIKCNYMPLVKMHIGRLLNVTMPHVVLVNGKKNVNGTVNSNCPVLNNVKPITLVPAKIVRHTSKLKETASQLGCHINEAYSFDSFIVGPSSSLAYAAAKAVAENPGLIYNPLFIYGRSGLGKTHLLHALGNAIRQNNKNIVLLYQTTDRFINEFINAIRFDKIYTFHEKYKSADVLLIDDVQFISNKEQTQEAFFQIFNSLYDVHKQIVFSSDTFPKDIKGLAERLQSRLSWGLIADIHAPSLETKVAILKRKAELQGERLSDDVAYFIASHVVSNIRELEGALIRVTAFSLLTKQPLSLELAKKVLVRSTENKQGIDFMRIVRVVNKYYPYNLEQLRSKSRNKNLAFARHLLMFFMKKMTGKSLRDIGNFLGGRDHSTVLNGVNKIEEYLEVHPEFHEKIHKIKVNIS